MMTHEQFGSLLGDYAEGMLPVGQMGAFRQHLASCPQCAMLADAYTSVVADLHAFPRLEVPEGFTAKVLQVTTRRPTVWETARAWLGLPRFAWSPAAGVLLSAMLIFLAGTTDGRRVAREINMATHQTYSNAVRWYYRGSDLRQAATTVGRKLPGRLEGSWDWIRQRLEKQPSPAPQGNPPTDSPHGSLNPSGEPAA